MQPDEFSRLIDRKAEDLRKYADTRFPTVAGNIALRFVNGNFRAQGFQGTTFKKWKENKRGGTILVKSGKLRTGTNIRKTNGEVTIFNQMPYARIHNEGGKIKKKETKRMMHFHIYRDGRSRFAKAKKSNFAQEVTIREHEITLPRRQFIPTEDSKSPVLENTVMREVAREINLIMNQ